MFTGIIETVGTVKAVERRGGDLRLHVHAPKLSWQDVKLGDSIATNGVCLTAVELPGEGFVADVSVETLQFTTVGHWTSGTSVNLEKALTPFSRLGGHMVAGHVDDVGEIVERHSDARSERFVVRAPQELAKYIAGKGSITVDGISLTVNAVEGECFHLNIVPHTLENTTTAQYVVGTKVNLEVDVIARYLERLLMGAGADKNATAESLTYQTLAEHGFAK